MATIWKNSCFILSERSDFHMINNLAITVHAFPLCMLKLFLGWDMATEIDITFIIKLCWQHKVIHTHTHIYIYIYKQTTHSYTNVYTDIHTCKQPIFFYYTNFHLGFVFCIFKIHRWLNIINITPHGPDDGSVESKRYSVDFLINLSFHLLSIFLHIHIYMNTHTHIHVYICIYTYTYIYS